MRLEITTVEMANSLISENLIKNYELKVCERSLKKCRIIQCFNCWEYGHIIKICKHQIRCGHCAYEHETNFCDAQNEPAASRCAACGMAGHKAWSAKCEVKKTEKKKSEAAFNAFPLYYKTAESRKATGNETKKKRNKKRLWKPGKKQQKRPGGRRNRTATQPLQMLKTANMQKTATRKSG